MINGISSQNAVDVSVSISLVGPNSPYDLVNTTMVKPSHGNYDMTGRMNSSFKFKYGNRVFLYETVILSVYPLTAKWNRIKLQ